MAEGHRSRQSIRVVSVTEPGFVTIPQGATFSIIAQCDELRVATVLWLQKKWFAFTEDLDMLAGKRVAET